MSRLFALIAALLLVAFPPTLANATPATPGLCGMRGKALERLETQHQQDRRAIGRDRSRLVIETFASPSGNWTLTVTRPDGITCFHSVGDAFEVFDLEGSDA